MSQRMSEPEPVAYGISNTLWPQPPENLPVPRDIIAAPIDTAVEHAQGMRITLCEKRFC